MTASETPHARAPSTVVGIGASAGGVQALQAFFEALPGETGMAFVVILHLDPERESQMAELLQAKTSLPVTQVKGRVPMEPDHVYVIPPDRRLEVTGDALSLSEFEDARGQRAPIDHFFRSLAEECDRVAAIVLSGGGADGAVGIKDVKASGGFIFAQDPADAEHKSMPRQAIATGVVDAVLSAREMAERLVQIMDQRAQLPDDPAKLEDGGRTVLRKILARLQSRTGYDFSQYKRSTVMRRIQHRMMVTSHSQISGYLRYLQDHDAEHQALFKELLVGVTSFFRDAASFEALQEQVVPALFEGKGTGAAVRAWVVGCATGEEAYSLATLLHEQADAVTPAPKIKVFASDLNEDALATARQGRYPRSIKADVSEARLQRFFEQEGSYYRAKRSLRDSIIFTRHSVLRDPPFTRLDLISCRNLLIYMQPTLQEQVFQLFHYALRARGYLFLGQAETAENTDWFRVTDRTHHLYQRRERSDGRLEVPTLPQGAAEPSLPSALDVAEWDPAHSEQAPHTEETLHRHALEDYAPPSALVDDRYHAVHLSERAGRYLQPPGGVPTKDLTELARRELQMPVRSALHRAFEDGAPTVAQPVPVQFNGHPRTVHLTVRPTQSPQGEPLALVIFNEGEAVEDVPPTDDADDPAIRRLENRLKQKQEQLQAAREEYEASREAFKAQNEELRSMNEEYKSATEELETSKEELQSVNEELQTVNTELENKLDALSRAHGDLQNLVDATEVGILFLDRALQIRRFSPPMTDILNIRDSDQGRPIGDLTHKLRYDALEADARQVLDDLVPIDKEVQSTEGAWYLMRIRPYRTVEDKIDGVVVSFVDITERRQAEEALSRREKRYRTALRNSPIVFAHVDDELRYKWVVNPHPDFEPAALIGKRDDELDSGPGIDALVALKRRVFETGEQERQQVTFARSDGPRTYDITATPLRDEDGRVRKLVTASLDITEQKRTEEALRESEHQLRKANEELAMLNQTLEERVEQRTQEVQELASRLTMAEQEERRRIAQILHDDLQQQLYATQFQLARLRRRAEDAIAEGDEDAIAEGDEDAIAEGDEDAQKALTSAVDEAEEHVKRGIETTRQLSVGLSPPVLSEEGLADALGWLATQMQTLHGLTVDIEAEHAFYLPNGDHRVLLFQAVRELLFNVVKHADVDRATVTLTDKGGQMVIRVEDGGSGFDPDAVASGSGEAHFGLQSIHERLDLFGGRLEIDSAPEEGTRATVFAPLQFYRTHYRTQDTPPEPGEQTGGEDGAGE